MGGFRLVGIDYVIEMQECPIERRLNKQVLILRTKSDPLTNGQRGLDDVFPPDDLGSRQEALW